jgi:hypothetical protein
MIEEKDILTIKNPLLSYSYCFLYNETANIAEHEKIIIDSKNIMCCYDFAFYIKNSNKQKLFDAVLASGDLYWIELFYNQIHFDKTKYETLMLFI